METEPTQPASQDGALGGLVLDMESDSDSSLPSPGYVAISSFVDQAEQATQAAQGGVQNGNAGHAEEVQEEQPKEDEVLNFYNGNTLPYNTIYPRKLIFRHAVLWCDAVCPEAGYPTWSMPSTSGFLEACHGKLL